MIQAGIGIIPIAGFFIPCRRQAGQEVTMKKDLLIERAEEYIRKNRLLTPGEKVLVGLSGGADSVFLLICLKTLSFGVRALHVNHGIRGEAAAADERFCEDLCRRLDIPLETVHADVPAAAAEQGLSTEEAGRNVRREALAESCRRLGISAAATAHHLDDQAETVLMNLARGSGLKGCAGIRPRQQLGEGITLIHPLLALTREEIRGWLASRGLSWCEDGTNAENLYLRNRVRNEILPALREHVNSASASHIAAAAEDFAEADELLRNEAAKWVGGLRSEEGKVIIPCSRLLTLPAIVQRYVVREAVGRTDSRLKDISRSHIEAVLRLAGGTGSRRLDLPGGIRAAAVYDRLCFLAPGEEDVPAAESGQAAEKTLVWSVFSAKTDKKMPDGGCANWFDYDRINRNLLCRGWEAGDRMCVTGAGGHRKLGDILTDKKIPLSERDSLFVLAAGKEVLWVPGLRMAEDVKISEDTHLILEVREKGSIVNEREYQCSDQ